MNYRCSDLTDLPCTNRPRDCRTGLLGKQNFETLTPWYNFGYIVPNRVNFNNSEGM